MDQSITTTPTTDRSISAILLSMSSKIVLALSFLLPIFFLPVSFISPQFGTSLLFATGVILALVLYIVATFLSGSIDLPMRKLYFLGGILAVPLIYTLAGVSNGLSRLPFLGYTFDESTVGFIVLAFIYLFLTVTLFRTKKDFKNLYVAVASSATLLALYVLLRVIFGANFLSFGIFTTLTTTTVGNWNSLGIFFGITSLLSLCAIEMLPLSNVWRTLFSVALIVSLGFLCLVNFSTVWWTLGVSSLLFILYRMFNPTTNGFEAVTLSWKQRLSRVSWYSLALLAVSIVFIIFGTLIGSFITSKLPVTNVEVRPSLSVTWEIVKNTWKYQPLFGSGANTFLTQWLSYKPNDIVASIFWNTDFTYGIGLIPTFAVTTGIIGILSWLCFFAFYVYMAIKALFAKIDDSFHRYISVSSLLVSFFLWVMAIFYVPSSAVFLFAFLFTGLLYASVYALDFTSFQSYAFSNNPRVGFVTSLLLVVLLVASLALSFGLYKSSKSLWYFEKSSYALNTAGNLSDAEMYMAKAIATVPYDVYSRALSQIELSILNQVVNQDPKKVSQDDLQKQVSTVLANAINAGLSARDADPTNYLNWVALGNVYEAVVPLKVQGAYQSAQLAYNEAIRRNPKNPAIVLLFARAAADQGDYAAAKNYSLQAIQMKQNYLDAYYLLAQVEVANKNLQGAIDSVSAAAVLSPNDANVFFQLGILKYNAQDFKGAIDALTKSLSLAPDYANAKYFLGLSYEITGDHAHALQLFLDLQKTNPDNKDLGLIVSTLEAGKPLFTTPASKAAPSKSKSLPLKENQ